MNDHFLEFTPRSSKSAWEGYGSGMLYMKPLIYREPTMTVLSGCDFHAAGLPRPMFLNTYHCTESEAYREFSDGQRHYTQRYVPNVSFDTPSYDEGNAPDTIIAPFHPLPQYEIIVVRYPDGSEHRHYNSVVEDQQQLDKSMREKYIVMNSKMSLVY